jgi:hypothetical protein
VRVGVVADGDEARSNGTGNRGAKDGPGGSSDAEEDHFEGCCWGRVEMGCCIWGLEVVTKRRLGSGVVLE